MSDPNRTSDEASKGERWLSVAFLALLITQMMTAINDNIFRWLVIGVAKQFVEKQHVGFILTAGTACFVVPYLLLAAPAGYLADRFSKRTVIVYCKLAEIVIMLLGMVALATQNLWFIFGTVGCMGAQSALFSPSKMGCIPELIRPQRLSAANGLMGLVSVIAVVIGTASGNLLSDRVQPESPGGPLQHLFLPTVVLVGLALAGWLVSLLISPLPVANPSRRLRIGQPLIDLRQLFEQQALFRVALGVAFFWSLGTLANLNIDQFGFEGGLTKQAQLVPMLGSLVVGVGAGSVLAGWLSGDRVELGLLPLGAIGIALGSLLMFTVEGSLLPTSDGSRGEYLAACLFLVILGISSGLFQIPLAAYLQHHSPPESRGAILSASNFTTFTGILLASLLFSALRYPTTEGSLAELEQLYPLPPGLVSATDAARSQLRDDWRDDNPQDLRTYFSSVWDDSTTATTDAVGAAAESAVLARLLWEDFQQRDQRGIDLPLAEVQNQWPDQQPLIIRIDGWLNGVPFCSARTIFLICGLFTIVVLLYVLFVIPQATIRFLVWTISKIFYRIQIYGRENLPERGGALLVANHVSWLDGILMMLVSSRPVRMLTYSGNFQSGFMQMLARMWGAIMIGGGPKSIAKALRTARDAISNGEFVGIFPEGGITRSGVMQGFRPGMSKILKGTNAPVVPVYFDGLWGSIFSFERGRFFWKLPKRVPYPISIHFGQPLTNVTDQNQVRQAVQELGAIALERRKETLMSLPKEIIRGCKKRKFRSKIADSSGADLTGGSALMRALILRRLLRRHLLADDEKFVGVLLPPSTGAVVTNLAISVDGRVAINLNYTVSSEVMNQCVSQAGIKHVLTSRKVLEKLDLEMDADVVCLEDMRDRVTPADKLVSALAAYAVPTSMLTKSLGLDRSQSDDVLTIIFTSGSTGVPKGVMLTHANIASNVEAIEQVINLNPSDVILGILPFFHSFGFTVTLWAVMSLNIKGVYHFNPLDSRQIGKLCHKHGGTVLLSTPTFLRSYMRRCSKEEFASLDTVVAGAEKLPKELCDAFEEKFGIRPVEGYGTTELSPLVSVNIPESRSFGAQQVDRKEGTVGRPVPGVTAKTVHLEEQTDLPCGEPGMLLIKGPNVMKGYLNQPEKTAEVVRDGWYVTGDVAEIDKDGFIKITGRESRFSKIGGEMVPHVKVEETLQKLLGVDDDEDEDEGPQVAVTAVPDPKKGERLIVLHTSIAKSAGELCDGLQSEGLPNIFIPSEDSFLEVAELPVLGTGKLDLKKVKETALAEFS